MTNLLGENALIISAMGWKIEIKPRVEYTRLGKTEISKVSVKSSNELVVDEGIQCEYINRLYNYKVSWPSKSWRAVIGIEEIKKQFSKVTDENIQIVIYMKDEERIKIIGFRDNINIIMKPIGNLSLRECVVEFIEGLKKDGYQPDKFRFDDKTGGAFCTLIQEKDGFKHFQYQRYVIDSGRAYILTSTMRMINDCNLEKEVKSEFAAIINSFKIIADD